MNETILLDGQRLTLEQIETAARGEASLSLNPEAKKRVERSAGIVSQLASSRERVYGVNTGFGAFASRRIKPTESAYLSHNLILSHSAGVGPPFPKDVVRAAMLIRANTLAHGYSGVRPEIIETILGMLQEQVTPYIPSRGSLGSSGDLAPLAHMAIVFSKGPGTEEDGPSGKAWHDGRLMSGSEAMEAAGLTRLRLAPKEGLALTNGATFSAALLALGCQDGECLLRTAEIAAGMALEALLGVSHAFDDRLHSARPHPGQMAVAARIRSLTAGSQFMDASGRIHDAYSLRCIPQIIGPAWEILDFARAVATREVNAATDNPLLFGKEAVSGGNFHGEPLGLAADYLKIALAEVGALSERRLFRLVTGHTNAGLPPMLVGRHEDAGLHSGMMMLQYTAASLVLENQTLAVPNSLQSLPTSAGQEDLNANSTTAGQNLARVQKNLRRIIALELLTAAKALDLRREQMPEARMGPGSAAAHRCIRGLVPFRAADYPMTDDVESVAKLVGERRIVEAVAEAMG